MRYFSQVSYSLIVMILSLSLLSACATRKAGRTTPVGGNQTTNPPGSATTQIPDGTWVSDCFAYPASQGDGFWQDELTFSGQNVVQKSTDYADQTCQTPYYDGDLAASTQITESKFSLGNTLKDGVRELNLNQPLWDIPPYNVFKVTKDGFYLGDTSGIQTGETSATRPTTVNTRYIYRKK